MSNFEYDPPEPPGRDVPISDRQLADALTSIAATNMQIRTAIEGVASAIEGYHEDRSMIARRIEQRHRPNVPIDDTDETIAASQQEREYYRAERVQRVINLGRNTDRAERAVRQFREAPLERQMRILSERGGLQPGLEGGLETAWGQRLGDIEGALRRQAEGGATVEDENIINRLNENLFQHLAAEFQEQAPSRAGRMLDAIEQSGLRQLRYGQLPIQDILRSLGTLAGQAEQRRAGTAGRLAEVERRISVAQQAGQAPAEADIASQRALSTALSRGRVGRMGAGLVGVGARVLPAVGQAIGAAEVISNVVQNQAIGRYQEANRLGQVTGEGFRAGVGARFQAFQLGINPFDMISREVASQIVAGIRGQGFRGQQAQSLQSAVADTINDLGISVDQSVQLYTDAVRRNGLTIEQARRSFENFDDSAKNLGISMEEYTRNFMSLNQQWSQLGAGRQAPGVSRAIIAATPRGVDPGVFGQLFESARGAIAARTGTMLTQIGTPQNVESSLSALQGELQREQERARAVTGDDINEQAAYLSQAGIYFRGMNPDDIRRILQRMSSGRGLQAQVGTQRALTRYGQQFYQARQGRRAMTGNQITRALMGQSPDDRWNYAYNEFGLTRQEAETIIQRNRDGGDRTYAVQGESEDIPMERLRAMRMGVYKDVYSELTPEQRKTFVQRMGDRDFNVVEEVNRWTSGRANRVGSSQDLNGIEIRLKPGMEDKIFELASVRKKAIAAGEERGNR